MTVSCFILVKTRLPYLEWYTYLWMLKKSYSFSDITDSCLFSASLFHPRLDLALMSASPRKTQTVTPLQLFPHTTHTQLSETARTTRIDHHNTIIPPVDLSFQNLDSIAAIQTAFHVRSWECAGTIRVLLLWSSNSLSTLAFSTGEELPTQNTAVLENLLQWPHINSWSRWSSWFTRTW